MYQMVFKSITACYLVPITMVKLAERSSESLKVRLWDAAHVESAHVWYTFHLHENPTPHIEYPPFSGMGVDKEMSWNRATPGHIHLFNLYMGFPWNKPSILLYRCTPHGTPHILFLSQSRCHHGRSFPVVSVIAPNFGLWLVLSGEKPGAKESDDSGWILQSLW